MIPWDLKSFWPQIEVCQSCRDQGLCTCMSSFSNFRVTDNFWHVDRWNLIMHTNEWAPGKDGCVPNLKWSHLKKREKVFSKDQPQFLSLNAFVKQFLWFFEESRCEKSFAMIPFPKTVLLCWKTDPQNLIPTSVVEPWAHGECCLNLQAHLWEASASKSLCWRYALSSRKCLKVMQIRSTNITSESSTTFNLIARKCSHKVCSLQDSLHRLSSAPVALNSKTSHISPTRQCLVSWPLVSRKCASSLAVREEHGHIQSIYILLWCTANFTTCSDWIAITEEAHWNTVASNNLPSFYIPADIAITKNPRRV